ncbi:tetratricopeptide repeat-containing sulfotransferase family protein [Kordiimonas marina]|uniref:tetratricopeptide repeat-containing sulfotransferase family protein n=1 Tax=Kordiimonas marina TaxID=2872312 RepID=UPI00248D295C|nr:tetratricopeptide repeat-containing sulfotransferase family protein [Kordiimonas marina]
MIARATALMQKQDMAGALKMAESTLKAEPDNIDALYLAAVANRYLGNTGDAFALIARLQKARPDYGRAWQEAGHLWRAQGDARKALTEYEAAVVKNPALGASWQMLVTLYDKTGQPEAAANARKHLARLSALPRELVSVTSFLHEGRILKAETLCRAFLQKNPHHVEAMRLLADIGLRLHVLDDAEFLLESCLEFEPQNQLARMDYVNVLHKRQKFAKACEEADTLRKSDPGNPAFETLYANECVATGAYDTALEIYDRVVDLIEDNASIHMARGHALKTIGQQEQAIEAYRAAYAAEPDLGDAYWSLANLKTYRFTEAEMALMTAHEAAEGTGTVNRCHLNFALGKAHEDAGDTDAAFAFYERGNALKKDDLRYDPDAVDLEFELQKEICTPALMEKHAGAGHDDPAPIFIVGLPRAGSTLLEQILASHSRVEGTMELPNILALAHRLNGRLRKGEAPRYPAILEELTADQIKAFGEAFIEDTKIYRTGAPYFIDKMPNNFRHIGLIKLILPNAKIIDARRHPIACCFSGFKQLFAEGQEFTYGLEEIGRYYRGYVDLMDHWDRVFPGEILRVQYEDVVEDLEGQVRRMLDFCGLAFEDACLRFHETDRSVRTASSEQVRQPINRKGVGGWRPFAPHLGPLIGALGPCAPADLATEPTPEQ